MPQLCCKSRSGTRDSSGFNTMEVGYGKTASVLALIALSRPTCPAKPPTDQAPRIGSRALAKRAVVA